MQRKSVYIALMWVASMVVHAQEYKIPVLEKDEPMATGQFAPDWESLKAYEVPEWFRDAKFGIWAHWGPQCVEGSGDWMARKMYIEESINIIIIASTMDTHRKWGSRTSCLSLRRKTGHQMSW